MAGAGFGVEIDGLNQALRALRSLGVETADLKDVFGKIGTEGHRVMLGFVPTGRGSRNRPPGRLRRSLRPSRAQNKAVIRGGGTRAPHAGPQQWGWAGGNSGIRGAFVGQHFFEKTDAVMGPRAEQMLVEGLEDLIDRYDLN